MKILVTGITSAIGSAVADRLDGHEVIGLARTEHRRFPTILCDLREALPRLPTVDVCLHVASVTDAQHCKQCPEQARKVNVVATAALLNVARRFVFVSTGSVYGCRNGLATESARPSPENEYATTKLEAEAEVAKHPNAVVLRYFFPYGPATRGDTLINRLIRNIAAGHKIELHEDGRPRISPIYMSDLADATRISCLQERLTGIYNFAGNEVVSLRELAEMIGKLLGKRPRFRPSGKQTKDMAGCVEKMLTVFTPTVDLMRGLRKTIDHLFREEEG